jgi:mannose-6-phosphate isomerase-like protein (cupin superfamily)
MPVSDLSRRDFSALLPMLIASSPMAALAQAQPTAGQGQLKKLEPGRYTPGEAYGEQRPARTSHRFLIGMLPDNIRLEAHFTNLTPGAGPEPLEHHKHTEMWLVHEGTVTLTTNGVTRTLKAGEMGLAPAGCDHLVANASKTEPASYFVVAVGPPE